MAEPSDEALVERYLRGDRGAFAQLVERHERRVYNLAFRMLGRREDADDAVQDTFVTCLRKLSSFRGASTFTTWLHRVTLNVCYDALRKRGRERPEEEAPERAAPDDPASEAVAAVDVHQALQRVAEDFRAVLVLHDIQGRPYEEIAEAIGVPVGTVKSRLHRARLALAEALGVEQRPPRAASNVKGKK